MSRRSKREIERALEELLGDHGGASDPFAVTIIETIHPTGYAADADAETSVSAAVNVERERTLVWGETGHEIHSKTLPVDEEEEARGAVVDGRRTVRRWRRRAQRRPRDRAVDQREAEDGRPAGQDRRVGIRDCARLPPGDTRESVVVADGADMRAPHEVLGVAPDAPDSTEFDRIRKARDAMLD